MGRPVFSSNSIAAQRASSRPAAKPLTAERCVVTRARPPLATYASRKATARALPSSGSVAPPISSISASDPGPASARIPARVSIEEENVERSERIACASPISVRIERKTGTRVPAAAGIGNPALRQKREEPGRLQDDGLSAGVRARDDEKAAVRRKLHVERHRLPALPGFAEDAAAQLLVARVEQRMAGPDESPGAVVRDLGKAPLAHLAEFRLRLERVELSEGLDGALQVVAVRENHAAELGQEPLDLPPLLGGEEREVVVGLDDLHRLDEDGLAGPRPVVHDAWHARAARGLHRQAVAVVAQDDDRVAERFAPVVEKLLEQARHLAPPPAQPRADREKLRRGVVLEQAVLAEELRGARDERVEDGERLAPGREKRRVRLRQRAADGVGRAGGAHDRAELLGCAGASRSLEGCRARARRRRARPAAGGRGGSGTRRPPTVSARSRATPRLLERGGQRQNRRPSGRRSSEGRNEPKNDAELERLPVGAASVCGS